MGERLISVIGVFGANGFIGRAIVRRLMAEGRRVIALGRGFSADYDDAVGGKVETRIVDFTAALPVHAALQGIDQAINLVNSSSPALGNNRVVEDVSSNVLPHISFIQSCLLSDVSRILFLSSGGTVYGTPRYLPLDEDHPTNPLNSYGATKMMVEQYLRLLTRDTATSHTILRVANPFGPGQILRKGQGLVASILERRAIGLPITVHGDGGIKRDYLYIDDLCDAMMAALNAPFRGETFNIGTGQGRSILDVVAAVEAALGETLEIRFADARTTDVRNNVLDCVKAARMLGWTAQTSFSDGMNQTVAATLAQAATIVSPA